jgi:phycobilisome rod-core linker protein
MGIPLLETKYVTRPHRVASIPQMGFEDEPIAYNRYDMKDEREFQGFVYAAYRQILGEQLILESNRQTNLESQLRNGAISVQDFVRGMGKSEVYRRLILEPNSNYRFVEITLKRFLGREPYSKQETIKWSIVIAEKGYHAFIDAVVDSPEYVEAFGNDTLPYQRRPLSQPYNLVTPSHAADWLPRQTDQRRPGEAYTGPMLGVGAVAAAVSTAPTPYVAPYKYIAPTFVPGVGYKTSSSYNPEDVAKGLIPLLDTKYVTRPHRVATVPQMAGEDKPLSINRYDMKDEQEFQNFIYAAYRQIFSEQQSIDSNRQTDLESQLRNGAISVQDFVRGLGKSEVFRRLVLEPNNNYRFVDVCLKRFLGREPYNKEETIKLSIIIAQKGYYAFIDALVDSEEYREAFGTNTLPYQLRQLNQPYNLVTPRFGADWLSRQTDQRRPGEFYGGPTLGFAVSSVAGIKIPTYGTTREPAPYKTSSSYNPEDVAKGLIPLLDTKYASGTHRVATVPQMAGEDKPLRFNRYDLKDEQEFQNFLYAAYRQIFSEQQSIDSNRQTDLESQLRNGSISIQDFVRGLGKSEVYRRLVLEPNNNYRFVDVCLKRFLGREAYGKQEMIKYSIIIAQKGYHAFIDALVDSDEYRETFGSDILPYQLRQLSQPYNLTTPRFDYEWRSKQPDQLRPGQRYSGPVVLIGWRAALENYTVREEVKAGDKAAFMDMAQSIPKGGYGQPLSSWNIKIPDMTNDRTPELVGARREVSPGKPSKR